MSKPNILNFNKNMISKWISFCRHFVHNFSSSFCSAFHYAQYHFGKNTRLWKEWFLLTKSNKRLIFQKNWNWDGAIIPDKILWNCLIENMFKFGGRKICHRVELQIFFLLELAKYNLNFALTSSLRFLIKLKENIIMIIIKRRTM